MSGVLFVVYIPSEKYELSLRSQDQQHAEEQKQHVQSPKQNIPQSQSKKHQIKDNNDSDKKLNRDVNLIREAKTTNGCDEIPERTPFLKVCLFFRDNLLNN